MKILVAFQGRHPYSFGDKFVLSSVVDFCLNKITDTEPYLLSFEQFLIQCMVMVKNMLECKEYKPSLTGRVMDENGVTLEQMKKNISSMVGGVLTSLLPNERIVLLCNVLIRRYCSLLSFFIGWLFYNWLSGFLTDWGVAISPNLTLYFSANRIKGKSLFANQWKTALYFNNILEVHVCYSMW